MRHQVKDSSWSCAGMKWNLSFFSVVSLNNPTRRRNFKVYYTTNNNNNKNWEEIKTIFKDNLLRTTKTTTTMKLEKYLEPKYKSSNDSPSSSSSSSNECMKISSELVWLCCVCICQFFFKWCHTRTGMVHRTVFFPSFVLSVLLLRFSWKIARLTAIDENGETMSFIHK